MNKARLEAFSDGVFAVAITIMVLELKVPHSRGPLEAFGELWPVLLSYAVSFIYIGTFWVNHQLLLHALKRVTNGVLWANNHLLFWLSLISFTTGWAVEDHSDNHLALMLYGAVLLMSAIAYTILLRTIVAANGHTSALAQTVGRDFKGKLSIAAYIISIPLAYFYPWAAEILFVAVAFMWLIPDHRVKKALTHETEHSH